MFFLLSKILDVALLPTVWLVALLLGALVARQPHRQRQWLRAAALLALVGTNPGLANEALRAWERPAVPLAALPPRADAAVLLGGITDDGRQPADRVYLHAGADRLTNALWLYRAGRVRRIIVSGGSGAVGPQAGSEARHLATLLRLAAVPPADIWLEQRSRNTHENAQFTKQLLAHHPGVDTLVLVTSAFHMRRAAGCFAKAGLLVVAFPAGFQANSRAFTPDYWLLPTPEALEQWSLLLHEMAGWAVYKARGWC